MMLSSISGKALVVKSTTAATTSGTSPMNLSRYILILIDVHKDFVASDMALDIFTRQNRAERGRH